MRLRMWEKALPQLYFLAHPPSLLPPFIGSDLQRLSAVVFHVSWYDGRCALPLLCTFCTKAVREGKSSPLMGELTGSKREIPS